MTVVLRARALFALLRGRQDFVLQIVIWFGFAFAYQATRGLADRGTSRARW